MGRLTQKHFYCVKLYLTSSAGAEETVCVYILHFFLRVCAGVYCCLLAILKGSEFGSFVLWVYMFCGSTAGSHVHVCIHATVHIGLHGHFHAGVCVLPHGYAARPCYNLHAAVEVFLSLCEFTVFTLESISSICVLVIFIHCLSLVMTVGLIVFMCLHPHCNTAC